MNIRDLEYFNALAEMLSFTQVAHKFAVSQPTVSYAIKRLEENYGCDLIAREASHRSISLTTPRLFQPKPGMSQPLTHSRHTHRAAPPSAADGEGTQGGVEILGGGGHAAQRLRRAGGGRPCGCAWNG